MEPGGFLDFTLVLMVVAAALGYLYHKIWRKRGACSDCTSSKAGCASGCQVGPIDFDKSPLKSQAGESK